MKKKNLNFRKIVMDINLKQVSLRSLEMTTVCIGES